MFRNLVAAGALLLASCGIRELPTGPGGGEPLDPTATLTRVQNEIFTPTCAAAGCHDLLGRQESLVLIAGRAHSEIVNVPSRQNPAVLRVDPGRINMSYLYRKVIGVGISGDRMPQGRAPLTDAQTKLIRDWIRRGAPND